MQSRMGWVKALGMQDRPHGMQLAHPKQKSIVDTAIVSSSHPFTSGWGIVKHSPVPPTRAAEAAASCQRTRASSGTSASNRTGTADAESGLQSELKMLPRGHP